MRLFISIYFDDETKEKILEVQQRLKKLGRGRFTASDNLHLTLAFLGEVGEERVPGLQALMDGIKVPEMQLVFSETGAFRGGSELWWIGIRQNELLSTLQSELVKKLKASGFKVDSKKFKPHITLAREMHIGHAERGELLTKAFSCTASHMLLMMSHRPGGKLTYTELYRK